MFDIFEQGRKHGTGSGQRPEIATTSTYSVSVNVPPTPPELICPEEIRSPDCQGTIN